MQKMSSVQSMSKVSNLLKNEAMGSVRDSAAVNTQTSSRAGDLTNENCASTLPSQAMSDG